MKNNNKERNNDERSYTIGVMVENKFGVLARIAGLFSGRGYNIESLSVAQTLDPSVSRMTIVTWGNQNIIEQIMKQLNKLIDVIRVIDISDEKFVDREMVLLKVNAQTSVRSEVLRIADIFRCKIVDVSSETYTIEITGDGGKIKAIIDLLKPIGIKEIVRTGKVAITRGGRILSAL